LFFARIVNEITVRSRPASRSFAGNVETDHPHASRPAVPDAGHYRTVELPSRPLRGSLLLYDGTTLTAIAIHPITVRGEYSMWCPAERATVRASVQTEGPEGEAVFARAVASSQVLGSSIRTLHDADSGPVTWWTSDNVRTWSDRPWSEGKQLPLIHRSAIEFSVKFSDFQALARWVENADAIATLPILCVIVLPAWLVARNAPHMIIPAAQPTAPMSAPGD